MVCLNNFFNLHHKGGGKGKNLFLKNYHSSEPSAKHSVKIRKLTVITLPANPGEDLGHKLYLALVFAYQLQFPCVLTHPTSVITLSQIYHPC